MADTVMAKFRNKATTKFVISGTSVDVATVVTRRPKM